MAKEKTKLILSKSKENFSLRFTFLKIIYPTLRFSDITITTDSPPHSEKRLSIMREEDEITTDEKRTSSHNISQV